MHETMRLNISLSTTETFLTLSVVSLTIFDHSNILKVLELSSLCSLYGKYEYIYGYKYIYIIYTDILFIGPPGCVSNDTIPLYQPLYDFCKEWTREREASATSLHP